MKLFFPQPSQRMNASEKHKHWQSQQQQEHTERNYWTTTKYWMKNITVENQYFYSNVERNVLSVAIFSILQKPHITGYFFALYVCTYECMYTHSYTIFEKIYNKIRIERFKCVRW